MFLGAGSIGLFFGSILMVAFFGGCGMLLAGGIGFGITTAKRKEKRIRAIFAIIAAIGIVLILIPSIILYLVRKDNAKEREHCIETKYNTEYQNEKIDGKHRICFEYKDEKYVEVMPDCITEEGIETLIPNRILAEDKALLNIHEHIGFMNRLFSDYEQETVFEIKSDYGTKLLATEDYVFCTRNEMKEVEAYYEDLSHYDFYVNRDDDWSARKGKPVEIEEEMQKISKLDFNMTVRNPKGHEIEIDYVSKDDLFEGHLLLINEGEKMYLYIKEYDGDYEEDFVGEYIQIPKDFAKKMISKLKRHR